MPTLCVYYATDPNSPLYTTVRMKLAELLIRELPGMVVAALAVAIDIEENQMTIDIQPYHPQAHNVASLAVIMQLSRGARGEVYAVRESIRNGLVNGIVAWLRSPEASGYAGSTRLAGGIDVNLVFADSCGANVNPGGELNSSWG